MLDQTVLMDWETVHHVSLPHEETLWYLNFADVNQHRQEVRGHTFDTNTLVYMTLLQQLKFYHRTGHEDNETHWVSALRARRERGLRATAAFSPFNSHWLWPPFRQLCPQNQLSVSSSSWGSERRAASQTVVTCLTDSRNVLDKSNFQIGSIQEYRGRDLHYLYDQLIDSRVCACLGVTVCGLIDLIKLNLFLEMSEWQTLKNTFFLDSPWESTGVRLYWGRALLRAKC